MTTASRRIPLIGVFFLLPSLALADTGTPLMWVGFLHLVFGNLLIGTGEGFLISAVFKTRRLRSIFLMIAANYFSVVAGLFLLWWLTSGIMGDEPLYRLRLAFLLGIVLSFFLTILLEWPFCFASMKGQQRKLRRSFLASFLAQAVSYSILVPSYHCVSSTSILDHVQITRDLIPQTRPDATIYYLSAATGDVCKIRINGTEQEEVMRLGAKGWGARLFAEKNPDGAWDLWVTGSSSGRDKRLLIKGFTRRPVSVWERGNDDPLGRPWGREGLHHPDFRPQEERNWEVRLFINGGFNAGWISDVYLDTPFASWWPDCPVLLPGNRVVFQFGPQIALLDLNQRKIGMVALGRGPLVVWEGEPPNLP